VGKYGDFKNKREPNPVRKVIQLNRSAKALIERGNYCAAFRVLKRAQSIKGEPIDWVYTGNNFNLLGKHFQRSGHYEKSFLCFQEALGIAQAANDSWLKDNVIENLGKFGHHLKNKSHYRLALKCYAEAINELLGRNHIGDVGWFLRNMGVIYRHIGLHQDAEMCNRKALEISGQAGESSRSRLFDNILAGILNYQRGLFLEAEDLLLKSLKLQRTRCDDTSVTKHVISLMYLEWAKMAPEKLQKAEKYAWEGGNPSSIGSLFLAQNRYREALNCYEQVLEETKKDPLPYRVFAAHTGLGKVYEHYGDYEEAERHYEDAMKQIEEIRSGLGAGDLIPELQQLDTERNDLRQRFFDVRLESFSRIEPYEGLARSRYQLGKYWQAMEVTEKTKARSFADCLDDRKSVGECGAEISRQALARALKPDEVMVAYDVTETGLIVYSFKKNGDFRCVFLTIARNELKDLVQRFRQKLSFELGEPDYARKNKLRTFDLDAGRDLCELLLGDLISTGILQSGARLIIIPDEFIGLAAFETLVLEHDAPSDQSGVWRRVSRAIFAGDLYDICYYQSVSDLLLSRSNPDYDLQEPKLLIVADPVYTKEDERFFGVSCVINDTHGSGLNYPEAFKKWGRLEFTNSLADDLENSYWGNVDIYKGFRATKEIFIKEISCTIHTYRDIVFATHGYAGDEIPEPALILGLSETDCGPGQLTISEIAKMEINADIVVLAACHTGMGEILPGEGVMALGRAFRYAGARSVLMSLWSVEIESSITLVRRFFEHRKAEKSKIEALRLARADLRRDPKYDHPFFWAGLVLMGEHG
jgi:tetratricopeptide (TPR) repeat protein